MALSRVTNPVDNVTTLLAADWKAEFDQIYNNSLTLISPLTGNLATGGFKLTGLGAGSTTGDSIRYEQVFPTFNETKGADITAAATINLDTATGNLVDVTGNTGITAITLSEGRERTTRFTGTPTITNGASLVLLGGADITAAAGDFAIWRGYAAGVVRLVHYARGADHPGSGLVLLNAQTASASATIDFTTVITSAFDLYKIVISNLVPATDASQLQMVMGTGAGPTYDTGANYDVAGYVVGTSTALAAIQATGQTSIAASGASCGTGIGESTHAVIYVSAPAGALYKNVDISLMQYSAAPEAISRRVTGVYLSTTAVTAFRFLMSAGNITSGNFALYGVRKA